MWKSQASARSTGRAAQFELTIDRSSPGSLADKLADGMTRLIDSGRLRPGERLLPEPALAKQVGVGRNTVRRAMRRLQKRGLVQRSPGRGTFVTAGSRQTGTETEQVREHFTWRLPISWRVTTFAFAPALPTHQEAWRELIDGFEAQHLHCRVETKPLPCRRFSLPDDIRPAELPDVYQAAPHELIDLERLGLVQPWGRLAEAEVKAVSEGLFSWAVEACTGRGRLLTLPIGAWTRIRLYNTGLLSRLGLSAVDAPSPSDHVTEVRRAAAALSEADLPNVCATMLEAPLLYAAANGVSWVECLSETHSYDGPAWQATLEQIWQMSELLPWAFPFVSAAAGPPADQRDYFGRRRIAVWPAASFRLSAAERYPFDMALAPGPLAAGARPFRVTQSLAVNPSAGDVELARRFVAFAAGPQGQRVLARHGICVPAREEAATSAEFLNGPRFSRRPVLDHVLAAEEMLPPGSRHDGDALLQLQEQVINPVVFSMIARERDVRAAMAQLARRHAAFLARRGGSAAAGRRPA